MLIIQSEKIQLVWIYAKKKIFKAFIFLLSPVSNFPPCSAAGQFLPLFAHFYSKTYNTTSSRDNQKRTSSSITFMLDPLHASTLLFFYHRRLLFCSFTTPGSSNFFYPYQKHQTHMYSVNKLLGNLFTRPNSEFLQFVFGLLFF